MSIVTRETLTKAISEQTDISEWRASRLLNQLIECMLVGLVEDGKLSLTGLGRFIVRHKQERMGRNPKTGEAAVIPARWNVSFRASQKLFSQD